MDRGEGANHLKHLEENKGICGVHLFGRLQSKLSCWLLIQRETLYILPRCHIPWTHQELKYTIPTNFITYRFHVGVEPAHIIATCKNNLFIYCIGCLNTNTPIVINHPICAPIRTIAPAFYKLTI